jgi:hypothetical protein
MEVSASASSPRPLYPWGNKPGAHWMEFVWVYSLYTQCWWRWGEEWWTVNGLDLTSDRCGLLTVPIQHSFGDTKQYCEKFQSRKPTEIQTQHFMNAGFNASPLLWTVGSKHERLVFTLLWCLVMLMLLQWAVPLSTKSCSVSKTLIIAELITGRNTLVKNKSIQCSRCVITASARRQRGFPLLLWYRSS